MHLVILKNKPIISVLVVKQKLLLTPPEDFLGYLTDGELETYKSCLSISDKNGNLLFHSDVIRVYNSGIIQIFDRYGKLLGMINQKSNIE